MEKVVQTQTPQQPVVPTTQVVKPMVPTKKTNQGKKLPVGLILAILVVFAGIFSGYTLAQKGTGNSSDTSKTASKILDKKDMGSDKEVGVESEDATNTNAEGVLKAGGINGEGTHRLERGMGAEKDVSLVSTSINLENFVDKKVQVWGQTIAGKATWLMDVGRVKILE